MTAAQTKKPANKPRKNQKVDKLSAVTCKQNGLTYSQIAKLQNVSPQAIHKSIQHLLPTQDTEIYKRNRANIFAEIQRKIVTTIDDDCIKDASLLQRITAAGIVYDKERLETGQSTGNIAVLIGKIEDLQGK
jgi:hypothetical protein